MKIQKLLLLLSFLGLTGCSTLKKPFYYQIEGSDGRQGRIFGNIPMGVTIDEIPEQIKTDLLDSQPAVFETYLNSYTNLTINQADAVIVINKDMLLAAHFVEAENILNTKENYPETFHFITRGNSKLRKNIADLKKLKEQLQSAQNNPQLRSYKAAQFSDGKSLKNRISTVYWDYIVTQLNPLFNNNIETIEKLHIETIYKLINPLRKETVEMSRHTAHRFNFEKSAYVQFDKMARENKKINFELDEFPYLTPNCKAELYLHKLNEILSYNGEQIFEKLIQLDKAYRSGDINQVMQMQKSESADLIKCIYTNRNIAWIPKMEKHMLQSKSSGSRPFFIIEAGHLGGEQGVLKLLEDKGYSVDRIEIK